MVYYIRVLVVTLLSAGLFNLLGQVISDEAVVGLELLQGFFGVVNEGETGALATTELGAKAEDGYGILGRLVDFGELHAELIFGHVGFVWMEDVTIAR